MESRVVVSLWGSAWALDRHRADLWPHHLLAVWLRAKKWKLGLLIWQRVHWGGDVSSCPTCDEHSVCWDLASSCVFSLAQINFYENSLQVCTFLHRQSQDNLEGSKSKKVPIRKKITWRWKNVKKKKNLSLWKQLSTAKPLGFKMSLLHLPPRTLILFPPLISDMLRHNSAKAGQRLHTIS